MRGIHREGDLRACGALTVVIGQVSVLIEGRRCAVAGDINNEGQGELIPSQAAVLINGLPVIGIGDLALPDTLCPFLGGFHCDPFAITGSTAVMIG